MSRLLYDCLNSLFYYNSTKLIVSPRAVPMSLDMSNKVLLLLQKLSAITVSYDTDYLNFWTQIYSYNKSIFARKGKLIICCMVIVVEWKNWCGIFLLNAI